MADPCETNPTRRRLLGAAGTLFAWSMIPAGAYAAGRAADRRFIVIVLRGALDGLAAVPPVGDPAYAALREPLALSTTGAHAAIAVDPLFALHPALPYFARLYTAGQALIVHAAATAYRERSHFGGQEVLESGQPVPGLIHSGFLNRAFGAMTPRGMVKPSGVLGVGVLPPLVARGEAPVTGWAPPHFPLAREDLLERVMGMYGERHARLASALASGYRLDAEARATGTATADQGATAEVRAMRAVAAGMARLFAADDGPRVGALAFDGWDTHANQGGATGRLATLLAGLDAAFEALHTGLGPLWDRTVIAVITEFGRTARINGTVGSDHGTATTALLAGGAVQGGRVLTDWPGLGERDLRDNRDLAPTTDLRAVLKGALLDLYDLAPRALDELVFPGTSGLRPISGLIRAA